MSNHVTFYHQLDSPPTLENFVQRLTNLNKENLDYIEAFLNHDRKTFIAFCFNLLPPTNMPIIPAVLVLLNRALTTTGSITIAMLSNIWNSFGQTEPIVDVLIQYLCNDQVQTIPLNAATCLSNIVRISFYSKSMSYKIYGIKEEDWLPFAGKFSVVFSTPSIVGHQSLLYLLDDLMNKMRSDKIAKGSDMIAKFALSFSLPTLFGNSECPPLYLQAATCICTTIRFLNLYELCYPQIDNILACSLNLTRTILSQADPNVAETFIQIKSKVYTFIYAVVTQSYYELISSDEIKSHVVELFMTDLASNNPSVQSLAITFICKIAKAEYQLKKNSQSIIVYSPYNTTHDKDPIIVSAFPNLLQGLLSLLVSPLGEEVSKTIRAITRVNSDIIPNLAEILNQAVTSSNLYAIPLLALTFLDNVYDDFCLDIVTKSVPIISNLLTNENETISSLSFKALAQIFKKVDRLKTNPDAINLLGNLIPAACNGSPLVVQNACEFVLKFAKSIDRLSPGNPLVVLFDPWAPALFALFGRPDFFNEDVRLDQYMCPALKQLCINSPTSCIPKILNLLSGIVAKSNEVLDNFKPELENLASSLLALFSIFFTIGKLNNVTLMADPKFIELVNQALAVIDKGFKVKDALNVQIEAIRQVGTLFVCLRDRLAGGLPNIMPVIRTALTLNNEALVNAAMIPLGDIFRSVPIAAAQYGGEMLGIILAWFTSRSSELRAQVSQLPTLTDIILNCNVPNAIINNREIILQFIIELNNMNFNLDDKSAIPEMIEAYQALTNLAAAVLHMSRSDPMWIRGNLKLIFFFFTTIMKDPQVRDQKQLYPSIYSFLERVLNMPDVAPVCFVQLNNTVFQYVLNNPPKSRDKSRTNNIKRLLNSLRKG